MEIWNLYNENRQPLNRTHKRGTQLKPDEFHIAVEIWVINSDKKILITLRDPNKRKCPNKWENTGGSVLFYENSKQGAIRELYEETGIKADENDLLFLGTHKEDSTFFDIYFLKCDIEINELKLQKGETVDAKWVDINTLDKMIKNLSFAPPKGKRFRLFQNKIEQLLSL